LKKIEVKIEINDKELSVPIKLNDSNTEIIESEDLSKLFTEPGDYTIKLSVSQGTIPYCFSTSFSSNKSNDTGKCSVKLEANLSTTTFNEGESSEINVLFKNLTDLDQGMSVIVLGLPRFLLQLIFSK
jgi:hypothetical protein